MTTMRSNKRTCAVCGATNEFNELMSSNSFDGPDLDLRPAEMMRSTMYVWIQECPECGYISEEVSDPSSVTKEWLKSDKYLTCEGITFKSKLAKQFYRYYLISLEDENKEDAYYAVLHAAWACDDMNDDANARYCRELAISLVPALIKNENGNKEELLVTKADLMRRAGQFDKLIDEYTGIRFDKELLDKILEFEIEKAKNKDASCYRVKDVTGKKQVRNEK